MPFRSATISFHANKLFSNLLRQQTQRFLLGYRLFASACDLFNICRLASPRSPKIADKRLFPLNNKRKSKLGGFKETAELKAFYSLWL
jgi:hypothetical protein